ncbi:hypothetical protein [Chryseobacterium jejuense]|uniref:Uncharacterized protein n=1 Tax=Chryseobacterium jejuense TaxID=445960 RepID=A0A2X2XEB8_CHRJE|nr:hypothetical protein [Chryseobacterium jejuense]SDJ50657.1 hypothetical protein SAMN05421542_3611 [Chryseobacterium jejuense]SQB46385.1 Uncharacterised protein [Chryseobacterium jejuense]
MKKEFQIKEPCSVARENMQEIPGGSFCDHCSKKVYDLADKTDDEITILLQTNSSVCGRIQADRLSIPGEKTETPYNFFQLPFRAIASGIFLSILFTSNLNAQKKKIDTLGVAEIQGMIWVSPKSEDENYDYPEPVIMRKLEVKPSGDSGNLIQYQSIVILTPYKRFKSEQAFKNSINIPADNIRMSNIFVFEGTPVQNGELNTNKYFLFVNKRHIKEDNTLNLNLDQAKGLPFNPKNKDFIYFLDGEEITIKEFEQYQKENKIDSYFLPEIYAEELFGTEYYFENGAIVSYRR